jgi:hypothetical protein
LKELKNRSKAFKGLFTRKYIHKLVKLWLSKSQVPLSSDIEPFIEFTEIEITLENIVDQWPTFLGTEFLMRKKV